MTMALINRSKNIMGIVAIANRDQITYKWAHNHAGGVIPIANKGKQCTSGHTRGPQPCEGHGNSKQKQIS